MPPLRLFAIGIRVRLTSKRCIANNVPMRAKPVWISSANNTISCSSHSLRKPRDFHRILNRFGAGRKKRALFGPLIGAKTLVFSANSLIFSNVRRVRNHLIRGMHQAFV